MIAHTQARRRCYTRRKAGIGPRSAISGISAVSLLRVGQRVNEDSVSREPDTGSALGVQGIRSRSGISKKVLLKDNGRYTRYRTPRAYAQDEEPVAGVKSDAAVVVAVVSGGVVEACTLHGPGPCSIRCHCQVLLNQLGNMLFEDRIELPLGHLSG